MKDLELAYKIVIEMENSIMHLKRIYQEDYDLSDQEVDKLLYAVINRLHRGKHRRDKCATEDHKVRDGNKKGP